MLRIHFLQQWHALSDPTIEERCHDTRVMRRFAQWWADWTPSPTRPRASTFRRLLETHGLAAYFGLANSYFGTKYSRSGVHERRGNRHDNAPVESFFGLLKREFVSGELT